MTITVSLPHEWKPFFDRLAEDGYNRSGLMLKMARILRKLETFQRAYPGGLPRLIEALFEMLDSGAFIQMLTEKHEKKESFDDVV